MNTRSRSTLLYQLFAETQRPEDKLTAERVFCLETALDRARTSGSEQTVAILDGLIEDLVEGQKDLIEVIVMVNGKPVLTKETLRFLVKDEIDDAWLANWLRDIADVLLP